MYKYVKLLFVFLVPLLVTTCSDDPGGIIDQVEEVFTEFALTLSGSTTEFLDESGAIDQTSDASESFKQGIADNLNNADNGISGVDKEQILITDIKPTINRSDAFVISFTFVEIPDATVTITVDECLVGFVDIILDAIAEETNLTIGDYTVTPIEDIVIENLDEDVGCPFEIDECDVCGGSGYNATGCCDDDVPDCTGICGGSNMTCNGNCFDNADNDCAGYENPDTCELNDHCHWAEVYDDGGVIYAYCHYDGPPECVWDCEGLCDWVGGEGQSEPSEDNPIAFCGWVLGTVNGDDDCSSDCIGNDLLDVQEVVAVCQMCVDANDPNSDACQELGPDDDYGDNCFEDSDPNWENECSTYSEDDCETYDYCHWEDYGDGEAHCELDGPESCVWDCEGICQWVDDDNHDVLGFCDWIITEVDDCTDDCSQEFIDDFDELHTQCDSCISSGDANSVACDAVDYGGDGDDECGQCHDDCDDNGSDENCHNDCETYYCDGDTGDNCYDWMDSSVADGCSNISDEGTCDSYNECYWENNPIDGENQCQVEGPPSCVWDCEGICDWEGNDNDEDPLGFCEWLVNADAGGCTSDCTDADDTEVQEYVELCELCLLSDDANSEACMATNDGDDDCHCFSEDENDTDCEFNDYDGCMDAGCSWHCDDGDYEDDPWDFCGQFDNEGDCMAADEGCYWDVNSDGSAYCSYNDELEWDECLDDCAAEEPANGTEFCQIIVGLEDSGCADDCDEEFMMELDFFKLPCEECLADGSCDERIIPPVQKP